MPKQAVAVLALFLSLLPVARAGVFFNAPINVGPLNASAVSVGDFNGDHRDDLAELVNGQLQVMLQAPDGTLAAPLSMSIPAVQLFTVGSADIGDDGTIEILVGHSGGLAVYKWNQLGRFDVANYPSPTPCEFLATGDISLDGAPDVFCHEHYSNGSIYFSGEGSALSPAVLMLTALYLPRSTDGGVSFMQPQVKDVTGDGRADLLLASGSSNSFFVYANDGAGGLLPPTAYAYPEEDDPYSDSIEVADLDGDGANEVIVSKPANSPRGEIQIYHRGAQGYLTLWQRLPSYDLPGPLLACDLDHDGRQDLLVAHSGWDVVGRYMGQGRAISSVERLSGFVHTYFGRSRYSVGDLNGDGMSDIAVANSFGVSVLYGRHHVASDFDGDGISDILWRHPTGKNVIWRSADSTKSITIDAVDPIWSAQATGDFGVPDAYGRTGVFWRNLSTGANGLQWINSSRDITAVSSQDWQVGGAGDFDGDDKSDLLWRNARSGANAIWKSGDYTKQQPTPSVTDLQWKIAGVGDFDGDGRADILWRHSISGQNVIWLAGRQTMRQAMTAVTDLAWQIVGVGDFNGDGKDDVLWRNVSTGANVIWQSANIATRQAVTGVTGLDWTIAAVGDYNGDGISDLLWRNGSSGANVVWRSADARQQQTVTGTSDLRWRVVR